MTNVRIVSTLILLQYILITGLQTTQASTDSVTALDWKAKHSPAEATAQPAAQASDLAIDRTNDDAAGEFKSQTDGSRLGHSPSESWSISYNGIFGQSDDISANSSTIASADLQNTTMIRNYVSLAYDLDENLTLAATAYWIYLPTPPDLTPPLYWGDPYLHISRDHVLGSSPINWFTDLSVHFPVSTLSQAVGLFFSLRTYNAVTYTAKNSPLTLGALLSLQFGIFENSNSSNDLDFLVAPNIAYKITDSLSSTLFLEMGAGHQSGDQSLEFSSEGNAIQPGLSWEITPSIIFSPFLNIPVGSHDFTTKVSFGATLGIQFF